MNNDAPVVRQQQEDGRKDSRKRSAQTRSDRKPKQKGRGFLRRDGLGRASKEPVLQSDVGSFDNRQKEQRRRVELRAAANWQEAPLKNGEGPRHSRWYQTNGRTDVGQTESG